MRGGLALVVGLVVVGGLWLVARSFPPARVGGQPPAADRQEIIERLDRIEKRLEGIEQYLAAARPPFGEQWVGRDRLRVFAEQPSDEIVVEQNGGWWTVTAVQKRDDRTLVHFSGWDNSWNEWVANDKLRYLSQPATLKAEQDVLVKWAGTWLLGVVVEVQGDRAQLRAKNPNVAAPKAP